MSKQIPVDCFKQELFDLLDETFNTVQGIYLDRGTSFFETLETISAEEASRPVSAKCASIAAQVEHVRFYLRVLGDVIEKKEVGKINWEESWQLKEVTPEEWQALKERLGETYESVLTVIKDLDAWEGEDDIGASLGILAHTAYHLGEIRQALCVIK
ncbi:MAG: DinB family protein [Chloroflexi bacterium]|nr:DinB family protein [Chloroflexota bacterium]